MEKYLRKDSPSNVRNVFGRRDKVVRSPIKEVNKDGNAEGGDEKRKRFDSGNKYNAGSTANVGNVAVEGDGIWKKLEEILQEIKKSKDESNERFEKLQKEMEMEREAWYRERQMMKQEVIILREKLEEYEERLNDQDNRSRRQNLIFRGLKEVKNESWEDSERIVKEFVKEKYGMDLKGVARAHRFGYQGKDWSRPIMVKFEREKERELILRNRKNLKGSKVYVDEDFARDTRLQRKKLLEVMKEKRKEGKTAFIKFDKLEIEGEMFRWNMKREKMERVDGKQKRGEKREFE